jgi:hypothetical protein
MLDDAWDHVRGLAHRAAWGVNYFDPCERREFFAGTLTDLMTLTLCLKELCREDLAKEIGTDLAVFLQTVKCGLDGKQKAHLEGPRSALLAQLRVVEILGPADSRASLRAEQAGNQNAKDNEHLRLSEDQLLILQKLSQQLTVTKQQALVRIVNRSEKTVSKCLIQLRQLGLTALFDGPRSGEVITQKGRDYLATVERINPS